MKIFDWVHRKFHKKDESSEDVKMTKAEHGTGALLGQVAVCDVTDDWRQGILTIGTFGYDPSPNGFNQQVQFHLFENEEELEKEEGDKEDDEKIADGTFDDEGGEQNPLVLNASRHGFSNEVIVCYHDQNATKSEITILPVDDFENIPFAETEFYKKKERITLADLFLADSDDYMQHTRPDNHEKEIADPYSMKEAKDETHSKLKLPFAKKFIPLMKENSYSNSHSRGIKKIHKMMTRMLRKKIHPELEGKTQRKENQIKYGTGNGVIEMASLLQTQDAIVCA